MGRKKASTGESSRNCTGDPSKDTFVKAVAIRRTQHGSTTNSSFQLPVGGWHCASVPLAPPVLPCNWSGNEPTRQGAIGKFPICRFPIFTHNTAERQDSPKHWQSQWHTVNGRGISVILSCIRSNFARNFPVNSRPQRTFPTISAAEFTSEIRKKSKKPGHGKNRFRIEEPRGRTQARAAMAENQKNDDSAVAQFPQRSTP